MWRRRAGWLALCLAALGLYLFENNAGTRLTLAAAAGLPLLAAPPLLAAGRRRGAEWDVFGLFVRRTPPTEEMAVPLPPKARAEGTEGERHSTLRAGNDPSETFQIREYVPGDPVRQLHWKLSAKLDKPMLREFSAPLEEPPAEPEQGRAQAPAPAAEGTPWAAPAALALYAGLWGSLCHMAGLSTQGLAPLLAGGAVTAALALLPKGRRRSAALLGAALGTAGALLLWDVPGCLDGAALLLDRLFAASEARQAYLYEKFAVERGVDALLYVLFPLGLLSGAVCGGAARWGRRWLFPAAGMALWAAVAWLGVSPHWGWLALLAAAVALGLLRRGSGLPAGLAALGALAALCAVVLLLFPGEDAALSAWEEGARDTLAGRRVVWAETLPPAQTPPPEAAAPEDRFHMEEETSGGLGEGEPEWRRPASVLLVILAFALALFVPAALSDRLKKRRAGNLAWREDPDPAAAVREGFLYAMRWLALGGVEPENVPYSGYAAQVGERFSPELRAGFEAVLPLWQEAAYSAHPMTLPQREAMAAFAEEARRTVWAGLSRRKRLLAKYVYGL